MASKIIGTLPTTQSINSYIDEYGIRFVDYNFTIESKDASKYIPKQGDIFNGIGGTTGENTDVFTIPSAFQSSYLVTRVNSSNLAGGLMRVQVNTAGTQNTQSPAIISTLPNYPLIFGLKTNANQGVSEFGIGHPTRGIGIMLSFIDSIANETDIFTSFLKMPLTFRGVTLPVPARTPFSNSGSTDNNPGQNTGSRGFFIYYDGFIRKEITFQRIGGVSLFKLIFAESGYYDIYDCRRAPSNQNSVNCQTYHIYNF